MISLCTRRFPGTCFIAALLLLGSTLTGSVAEPVAGGSRMALTDGRLFIPAKLQVRNNTVDFTLHLHGDPPTVEAAFQRAESSGVLFNVTLPGLSSVYREKFSDPAIWPRILEETRQQVRQALGQDAPRLGRVTVTSFSAGFGGVRELLKQEQAFHQINRLIMADSIYAGFTGDPTERRVDPDHMTGFLHFAREAVAGRKTFLLTHTDLHTPTYASTGETADYLLHALEGSRRAFSPTFHPNLPCRTRFARGRFEVLGFAGETGPDHMQHLRHLDLWLTRVESSTPIRSDLVFPGKEWNVAPTEWRSTRWDADGLRSATAEWNRALENRANTACLVVDSGRVILSLGPVDQPINCHSVRKSLLSALYGKLFDAGTLDLNRTVGDWEIRDRESLTAEEQTATVKDLLSARSGVYLPAEYETRSMAEKRPARGSHPPGSFFYYNNWDFNVLGTLYRKMTGRTVFEGFEREFAVPLAFQDFDRKRHTAFHHDTPPKSLHPAYKFQLSTRDRARIGLLFLADGEWNGRPILSREWVRQSTAPVSKAREGVGYGYLWWAGIDGWQRGVQFPGDRPFSARGNGGQYILVVPSLALVVALSNDTSQPGWKSDGEAVNALFQAIVQARKNP